MEFEDSRKWTDRRLMETFGKMTAIEVQEHKDGENVERIRARCLSPKFGCWYPGCFSGSRVILCPSNTTTEITLITKKSPAGKIINSKYQEMISYSKKKIKMQVVVVVLHKPGNVSFL